MLQRVFAIAFPVLLVPAVAHGQTYVSGDVSGTWAAAASPYVVNDHVRVPKGVTLTIEPGAVVLFAGHYRFEVAGTLTAIGTRTERIRFSRAMDNEASRGAGIRFVGANAAESVLSNVTVEYGRADDASSEQRLKFGGGIFVDSSKVRIESSEIRFNEAALGGGIFVVGVEPVLIQNNSIHDNAAYEGSYIGCGGAGIGVSYASETIVRNNTVFANAYPADYPENYEGGGGVQIEAAVKAFVNNTVTGNVAKKGSGIHVLGYGNQSTVNIANNIVVGNTGSTNGEQISLEQDYSAGVPFESTIVIDTNLIGTGGVKKVYRNTFESDFAPTNPIDGDARFRNAEAFDFSLLPDSPAVDAANAKAMGFSSTDALGLMRFDAIAADRGSGSPSFADLGAFEYCPSSDTNGNHICDSAEPLLGDDAAWVVEDAGRDVADGGSGPPAPRSSDSGCNVLGGGTENTAAFGCLLTFGLLAVRRLRGDRTCRR